MRHSTSGAFTAHEQPPLGEKERSSTRHAAEGGQSLQEAVCTSIRGTVQACMADGSVEQHSVRGRVQARQQTNTQGGARHRLHSRPQRRCLLQHMPARCIVGSDNHGISTAGRGAEREGG